MNLSIIVFKGGSDFLNFSIFLSLKIVVNVANIAYPDEMSPMGHFSWVFTVCQSIYKYSE